MKPARALALGVWLLAMALAALIVARARYSADLSAFLPRAPSAAQQVLIDQLQNGLAARLILIGIDGGDALLRARLSNELKARLEAQGAFLAVSNGDAQSADRDRQFVFEHRYQLSPAVTPERFSLEGLRAAISASLDLVNSPAGLFAQSMLRSDPTGETMQVMEQLDTAAAPHTAQGVWSSADGARALLLAETRALGSDTDGQAEALARIRSAFAAASAPLRQGAASPGAAPRLLLSGPAVFAVNARSTIEGEATRLALLSSTLIVALLLLVYRSPTTLLLGLLPVVSGALAGVAGVALGAGVVHGVTLGFGITLIGESVDYSIYLFVQSRPGGLGRLRLQAPKRLWQTIGLGMLTSVCGFASLLPSSFPGLSQLGLYSITGLIVAAAVTRLVLPQLLPQRLYIRDLAPWGAAAARLLSRWRVPVFIFPIIGLLCIAVLWQHRATLWNRDLAALSPVSAVDQALDAQLRGELGAPDISNLVVISAPDQEAVLQRAHIVGQQLDQLVAEGVIGGYENPERYLPSLALQAARSASLPDAATLRQRLAAATAQLPLRADALEEFTTQVAAARSAPALTRGSLEHTSMALAVDALLWQQGKQWHALLPLRANLGAGRSGDIDIMRVRAALASNGTDTVLALNMKQESDALYDSYLREAAHLALAGFAAIVLLLGIVLRSAVRVARVIAPLALAVLVVSALMVGNGVQLTILHLIGLLLIVAVGSNYALFFDRRLADRDSAELPLTLASLLIANACTVLGFGVLALAHVPVLSALGGTVAPGALLALWFAALLMPPALLKDAARVETPTRA